MSQNQESIGEIFYSAPELLETGIASNSSDLWSLGIIIYEMLVGHLPFKAESTWDTAQLILNAEVRFPPGFDPVAMNLIK